MEISDDAAFDAAAQQCVTLAELARVTGTPLPALGEAMTHAGVALLVREMGIADAVAYVVTLLSTVAREAHHGN